MRRERKRDTLCVCVRVCLCTFRVRDNIYICKCVYAKRDMKIASRQTADLVKLNAYLDSSEKQIKEIVFLIPLLVLALLLALSICISSSISIRSSTRISIAIVLTLVIAEYSYSYQYQYQY